MCLSLFPAQTEVFVSDECRKSLCEGKNAFRYKLIKIYNDRRKSEII